MQPSRTLSTIGFALAVAFTIGSAHAAPARAQSLRGSPASVDLMYTTAEGEKLVFLRTTADVYEAARVGALKLITFTDDLELDHTTFPFVLPATKRFADSLAREYHNGCGERIGVTSGARPMDKQPRNASPKSVHPTGMAVDFRKPRNPACLQWMRQNLLKLEDARVIEATEEQHPPHFHVAVLHQDHEPHFQLAAVAPDSGNTGKVRTAAGEVALRRAPRKRHRVKSASVASP